MDAKLIETDRLLLRRIHTGDAGALKAVLGDADVMRFSNGVLETSEIPEWIRKYSGHFDRLGYGPYTVVEKRSERVIGYCGLFYFPDICGQPEVEIGYRLAKEFWGNGFATEAAAAVRDYAFDTLGLSRLIAMMDPNNFRSIKIATKIGMRHENDVMFEGYDHPDLIYVVERVNWFSNWP